MWAVMDACIDCGLAGEGIFPGGLKVGHLVRDIGAQRCMLVQDVEGCRYCVGAHYSQR